MAATKTESTWLAGFGKADITAWEPELSMMGWGRMDNRITGVHHPLFARAAAVSNGESVVVYACIELMAVSILIRKRVLERLALTHPEVGDHNLMLTASHTHSGPSGYSEYFFMNLNGPGYSDVVVQAAVDGTVTAIGQALDSMADCDLRLGVQSMPLDQPVAFNRSWFAYNLNDDVEPVSEDDRDQIVNRDMTVLTAFRDGAPVGCVSWYAVHCTSIHYENHRIHPDNKGLAAADMERDRPGFVAVFAQEATGDVTPNYRYDKKRKLVVGHGKNDRESVEFTADQQRLLANSIIEASTSIGAGPVLAATHWVDFSNIEVSASNARGQTAHTTVATLGLSMAEGTAEGPGPILGLRRFNRWLSRQKARAQNTDDPKLTLIDVGRGLNGRFLGVLPVRNGRLPAIDASFAHIRQALRDGKVEDKPWYPQILPIQLMQIGPLLLLGLPFEVTTVAGRRLRDQLRTDLADRGVEKVIISGYSNGYSGYCTTFEEYQLQHYEAGYTLFGPHQLGAIMTMLTWMVPRLDNMPSGLAPVEFEHDALLGRGFDQPWTQKQAMPDW